MIKIVNASVHRIPDIQKIAEETWWPTYSDILTSEQLRYMLDNIYSTKSLSDAMSNGSQHFIMLEDDNGPQAFASYGHRKENETIFKLHKIYVRPGNQGKGYGKMLIDEIVSRLKLASVETLDLNVNRFNKAKTFYEKLGFKVIGEEDVPIGPYFMNDYIMRLSPL
jgi:ribosomal protein S18 acetylase RimI-like enzyme